MAFGFRYRIFWQIFPRTKVKLIFFFNKIISLYINIFYVMSFKTKLIVIFTLSYLIIFSLPNIPIFINAYSIRKHSNKR